MKVVEIRERLIGLAEPEYGDFVTKGAPSDYPVLGVRVPRVQELANEIIKSDGGAAIDEFLAEFEPRAREEMHLKSFILAAKIKRDGLDKKALFSHVKKMDSWEMVDIFCPRLKFVKKDREKWLEVIDKMLEKGEFEVRFGLVLLLDYYVEPEWIEVVFERILRVLDREEYYVEMGVAWLLQKCYVCFPDSTLAFMKTAKIPEWTLRKAVSKIQDSYRIDKEWKERAKKLLSL